MKKAFMCFVALLTIAAAATGPARAQQQQAVVLTTITPTSLTTYNETTPGAVNVIFDGQLEYDNTDGWMAEYGDGYQGSVTVTAKPGFIIDSCKFYVYLYSYTVTAAPFAVYPYCEGSIQEVYSQPNAQGIDVGYGGVKRIDVYGSALPPQPHNIRLAEGTEDAANWSLASGNASVPGTQVLENVMSGSQVTATYNGTQKVKSVKAVKYIALSVTDLATITENYTASDGEILTGTLGANVKISIADGATVTLNNVTINASGTWTTGNYAGITCEGDATITLEGTNTVKGFADGYPGIFASSGKTLVINGTGELIASSNGSYETGSGGAGIGGGDNMNCGNIEIQSGTVTATGNEHGAGIGGGQNANCGNITISGGTVTATGGYRAAGIGGGRRGTSGTKGGYDSGSCGNITISGGTVTATGGQNAAGIGGGRGNNNNYKSSCGTITITSGVTSVTATKGDGADNSIGAGNVGTCGTVTIGGVVGAITTSPYTYQP